jgi:hypothetical protein
MKLYNDTDAAVMGRNLARLFRMRRDPDHRDRWQTEWGNKTDLGLWRTFERIAEDADRGTPHPDLVQP